MSQLQKSKFKINLFILLIGILFFFSVIWLSALKSASKQTNTPNNIPILNIGDYKLKFDLLAEDISYIGVTNESNTTLTFSDATNANNIVVGFITEETNISIFNSESQITDATANIYMRKDNYGSSVFYYMVVKARPNLYIVFSGPNIDAILNLMNNIGISIDDTEYNLDEVHSISTSIGNSIAGGSMGATSNALPRETIPESNIDLSTEDTYNEDISTNANNIE